MGYLYIALSALCSLSIAHLLKVGEVKKLRTFNTLTVNYLVAGIFAISWGWYRNKMTDLTSEFFLLLFCLIVGLFFISNFVAYSKSVHKNGVGVTITAMRLSLLIPVLLSVILYKEYLNTLEIVGVLIVFSALVLLVPRRSGGYSEAMGAGWLLLIIFILSGFADASLKVYQEEFSMHLNELTFMGLIFAGAFLIGGTVCIFRKGPLITAPEAKLGALIGIPNLYSSIFLIYALSEISGAIAYPLVNILNVAGGTALGIFLWGDIISTKQWIGLGLALTAILLLL